MDAYFRAAPNQQRSVLPNQRAKECWICTYSAVPSAASPRRPTRRWKGQGAISWPFLQGKWAGMQTTGPFKTSPTGRALNLSSPPSSLQSTYVLPRLPSHLQLLTPQVWLTCCHWNGPRWLPRWASSSGLCCADSGRMNTALGEGREGTCWPDRSSCFKIVRAFWKLWRRYKIYYLRNTEIENCIKSNKN